MDNHRITKMLMLMLWSLSTAAVAETADPSEASAATAETGDPLGRNSPRGAVEGFLKAIDNNNTALAAKYIDLRNLPEHISEFTPQQLAYGLAVVLQRSTWIDLEELSNSEEGRVADDLPSYRDLLVQLETRGKPVAVLLQRVPDGQGGRIWKFSNATIAQLDLLYEQYRYNRFVEWLAQELPKRSLLGIELFKWVTLLITVVAAAPIVVPLAWWISRLLMSPTHPLYANLRRFMVGPVSGFVLILIFHQVFFSLGTGLTAQQYVRGHTLLTLATVWLLWQSLNLLRDIYGHRLLSYGRPSSIGLLKPLTNTGKLLVTLLGVLVWIDNLGYEITAVLTGLGIGGIAVALVLQKPLEDVFGAITLYTQQPIKIGDFGRFGAHTGTIEEISMRTTRIRTLDNTLVAVPNMKLASEPIENLSAREKFLYKPILPLRNDTPPAKLRAVLEAIRELLAEHDKVLNEGTRVRFTDIGVLSHDLSVFAYIQADDWAGYLEVAEALNFEILDVLAEAGAKLASPIGELVEGARGAG